MRLLFWNIHRNPIAEYVVRCAMEHDPDVICLAEHAAVDPHILCEMLGNGYRWASGLGRDDRGRVLILAKGGVTGKQLFFQDRYTVWTITCNEVTYHLAAVHFVDRMSFNEPFERMDDARKVLSELSLRESQTNCHNCVVVGDFNAEPFDPELVDATSFFATPFRSVISNCPVRVIRGLERSLMYNPVLQSLTPDCESFGSHWWDGKDALFWRCYDQVIVSKSLMNDVLEVKYIKEIGGERLVKTAGPLERISDHLPLFVNLGRA